MSLANKMSALSKEQLQEIKQASPVYTRLIKNVEERARQGHKVYRESYSGKREWFLSDDVINALLDDGFSVNFYRSHFGKQTLSIIWE